MPDLPATLKEGHTSVKIISKLTSVAEAATPSQIRWLRKKVQSISEKQAPAWDLLQIDYYSRLFRPINALAGDERRFSLRLCYIGICLYPAQLTPWLIS